MELKPVRGILENAAALVGREFVHFKGGHYRLRGFACVRAFYDSCAS